MINPGPIQLKAFFCNKPDLLLFKNWWIRDSAPTEIKKNGVRCFAYSS